MEEIKPPVTVQTITLRFKEGLLDYIPNLIVEHIGELIHSIIHEDPTSELPGKQQLLDEDLSLFISGAIHDEEGKFMLERTPNNEIMVDAYNKDPYGFIEGLQGDLKDFLIDLFERNESELLSIRGVEDIPSLVRTNANNLVLAWE